MPAIICKQVRRVKGGYIIELMPMAKIYWSFNQTNITPEAMPCEVVCKTWEEVMSELTKLNNDTGVRDDD